MFPGPMIRYNKSVDENKNDTIRIIEDFDYFCFDKDFKCREMKETVYDSLSGKIIRIDVIRATHFAKDGTHRRVRRIKEYGLNGDLLEKTLQISESRGRAGRILFFRVKRLMPNGQRKITVKRSSWRRGLVLERVRYRGRIK